MKMIVINSLKIINKFRQNNDMYNKNIKNRKIVIYKSKIDKDRQASLIQSSIKDMRMNDALMIVDKLEKTGSLILITCPEDEIEYYYEKLKNNGLYVDIL